MWRICKIFQTLFPFCSLTTNNRKVSVKFKLSFRPTFSHDSVTSRVLIDYWRKRKICGIFRECAVNLSITSVTYPFIPMYSTKILGTRFLASYAINSDGRREETRASRPSTGGCTLRKIFQILHFGIRIREEKRIRVNNVYFHCFHAQHT